MPSTETATARQKVSISELAERFLAQLTACGRSPLTVAMYRRSIQELHQDCRCDDIRLITRDLISSHVDRVLARKLSTSAKSYWIIRLKIFFRWLADEGLILTDPTAPIKLPAAKKRKYPPYLTQQEVARLLDSIPTEKPQDLHDRALLELLYLCGLRTSEVCRLTLNDINAADATVTILMGKGKKDRVVPIGKVARHYVDHYVKEVRGISSGPLFYHLPTGEPLKGWQLHRQIIAIRAKQAGIRKRCLVRTFRHSFAIHMLENGASIRHMLLL